MNMKLFFSLWSTDHPTTDYRHYNSTIPISISHPIIYGTPKKVVLQDKGKETMVDSSEGDLNSLPLGKYQHTP